MSWAAIDLLDPEIGRARPDRDAVVTRPNARAGNGHACGHLDMDSVGVGAISQCSDLDILYRDVAAAVDHNVVELAVYGC